MDPKDIEKLSKVLRNQGDKLLTSQFKFILTGELLRSLNDSFSLIVDENEYVPAQTFQVLKPNNAKSNVFRELMFIYDFIQKTSILKMTKFLDDDDDETCIIDISKFRSLTTLELQRINVQRVHGLHYLRSQLQEIVAERCTSVKDLLLDCGGDKTNSFIWSSLIKVDFSYNNLECVDSFFEFTPYLQHLNLSHNKIYHISALVWLPNLKYLNLSYNQLTSVPKLNTEASRRLQVLTINANLLEDISGIVRLDCLLELDMSDNCLLDHSNLLPLCTLTALRYLNLSGNPLSFHQKHRSATCRYLSKNAGEVQFQLDHAFLSKHEKKLAGSYENYYPLFGHRMTTSSSSRATPSAKSSCNTPDNSSLGSFSSQNNNFNEVVQKTPSSAQKRIKPRCVEIEESGNFVDNQQKSPITKKLLKKRSTDHLTTKKEIEKLREQFGNDWLHSQEGRESGQFGEKVNRELFEEFLNVSSDKDDSCATTPVGDDSNIKSMNSSRDLPYETANESTIYNTATDESMYTSFRVEEETIVVSDPEENEVQFIVVDLISKDDLFLTVSDMSIKEKDAMNMRTLTRWGIGTLESVERPKTCIIRLTFDTIRKDKRERQYEMEAKPCQALERMLRDYLSSKPLSEMNQTVFKCLKCNSEFSREKDERKRRDVEIKCPFCGNKYVVEIEKTPNFEAKPSPKTTSFFPKFLTSAQSSSSLLSPITTAGSKLEAQSSRDTSTIDIEVKKDDLGTKTSHSFSSIESAFDSNQSVAGSSVEVLSESSQMSHVSSQSSIEVLDRKPSEEKVLLSAEDESKAAAKESLENLFVESDMKKSEDSLKHKMVLEANVNLTESSSSGSVCESVVTAYEHNSKDHTQTRKISNLLATKSSKRSEAGMNSIQYNYDDLTNIDHRVKLHLFQNLLEDNDEKLVWLVKTLIVVDDPSSDGLPISAIVVMSTKKVYFLKIVGEEKDDVQSWLKKFIFYSIDKIEKIKEFSEKVCLSFIFSPKSSAIHLLLRDRLLFEKLKTKIITSNQIINFVDDLERVSKIERKVGASDLKSVSIFTSCSSSVMSATDSSNSAETQKSRMKIGSIFVFLGHIHITSSFEWICDNISEQTFANHLIMKQPISNLVDLENLTDSSFTLNFIDELEDTLEKWKFTFESNSQIFHLLKSIDDIWQKIFCISLLSDSQTMK